MAELQKLTKDQLILFIEKMQKEQSDKPADSSDSLFPKETPYFVPPAWNGKPMNINDMGDLEFWAWRVELYQDKIDNEASGKLLKEYERLLMEAKEKYVRIYEQTSTDFGVDFWKEKHEYTELYKKLFKDVGPRDKKNPGIEPKKTISEMKARNKRRK